MKKFLFLLVILFESGTALFAQADIPKKNTMLSAEQYLQKRGKQNTAAWLLLSGGSVLFITAFIIESDQSMLSTNSPNYNQGKGTASTIIGVTGLAATIASIPFFIAASKNKRKARSVSMGLKLEKTTVASPFSFTRHSYPALSINIKL